jgi:hypothetical protein
VNVVVSDERRAPWRRAEGVGGRTRPLQVSGKVRGEGVVDEEALGAAAALGEAPIEAGLPRAPADLSSQLLLLRRGGAQLRWGE